MRTGREELSRPVLLAQRCTYADCRHAECERYNRSRAQQLNVDPYNCGLRRRTLARNSGARVIVTQRKIKLGMFVIAVIAAITWGDNASAEPAVRIIEKGVYRAETTTRTITKEGTGILNSVQNVRLISDTAVVYGKVGVRFGVRYVLSGSAPSLDMKFVVKFPASGLHDPATGARYAESAQAQTVQTGMTNYWGYDLENNWEIAAGFWEFEFWADSKKLTSQVFCVIDISQPLDAAKNRECLPLISRSSNDLLQRR